MPYIDKEAQERLAAGSLPQTSGELNFMITMVVKAFLDKRYKDSDLGEGGKICYQDLNDVMGALEGCKLEFFRRVVSQYENEKIKENGDVWN